MRVKLGSCTELSGADGGKLRAKLAYDPLGRLSKVEKYTGNDALTGTTNFLYDGQDLIAEYDGNGAMLNRYVHGTGSGDDALVAYEGAATGSTYQRYLYGDRLGSIFLSTKRDGSAPKIASYNEYGLPGSANQGIGAGGEGRFQYTGQMWLPEIGMYHYKARAYSPSLGRFMQTDPIGYGDGLNMYAYTHNDPVNGVDPTGLFDFDDDDTDIVSRGDPCAAIFNRCIDPYDFFNMFRFVLVPADLGAAMNLGTGGLAGQAGEADEPQSDCSGGLQPVVLVPDGDTVGGDPSKSGNRYVTDLRGGYAEAMALFTAISRLNNQAYVDSPGLGDMFSGGVFDRTLAISHNPHTGARGAVRLRYGPDFRNPGQGQWKVDIARGANPNLNAAETVHFRASSRNRSPMCPTS